MTTGDQIKGPDSGSPKEPLVKPAVLDPRKKALAPIQNTPPELQNLDLFMSLNPEP